MMRCFHPTIASIVAVGLVIFYAFKFIQQRRANRWRSAKGIVEGHDMRHRAAVGDLTEYDVYPVVRFAANGTEYLGRHLSTRTTWQSGSPEWLLARAAEKYPVGSTVTVYYDPDDPSGAVLERGVDILLPALVIAAAVIIALGDNPFAC